MKESLNICEENHTRNNHAVADEKLSWYRRHRDAKVLRDQRDEEEVD